MNVISRIHKCAWQLLVVCCVTAGVHSMALADEAVVDNDPAPVYTHYLEGADIRVVAAKGAAEGILVATNQAGCTGKACPQQEFRFGSDTEVVDNRLGKQVSASYADVLAWGVFYAEVSYNSSGRALKVIRVNRPVEN